METIAQELIRHIQSVTAEIQLMTASMYEGNINDGLGRMPKVIDGIAFTADQYVLTSGNADKVVRLNKELSNSNEAIANNDFILFADIFEYEITSILDEMIADLQGKHAN